MSADQLHELNTMAGTAASLRTGVTSAVLEAWRRRSFGPAAELLLHREVILPFRRAGAHAPARDRTYWEEASFAVHALRTNCLAYRLLKRALDIVLVLVLCPVVLPLMLVIAVMVRCSSVGPIFYRHRRLGRFGREFTMWKFRSMHVNGDEILRNHLARDAEAALEWSHSQKLRDDPRITRVGRFLRRNSLDELPQFFNVLLGSMSLVGPRPIVEAEVKKYGDYYFFYTSARPGLSGLWQVSGRSSVSYDERIDFDKEYICTWSFAKDISILWRTASVVWRKHGAH